MTRLAATLLALIAAPALADPSVTVAFSPDGGSTEAVVAVIGSAQHTVHLAGYGFTSKSIAQALTAAHQRGADVELVLDKSNATARYTEATEVAAAGGFCAIGKRGIAFGRYVCGERPDATGSSSAAPGAAGPRRPGGGRRGDRGTAGDGRVDL
jgi:hypothetical protein